MELRGQLTGRYYSRTTGLLPGTAPRHSRTGVPQPHARMSATCTGTSIFAGEAPIPAQERSASP
eukprot:scaffold385290_cov27-Prasinocladus_malaysianus.AAC.1